MKRTTIKQQLKVHQSCVDQAGVNRTSVSHRSEVKSALTAGHGR